MESSSSPLCSTISAASLPNPSLPLSPSPMVSSGSPSVVYDHRKSESIIYYAKKQHRTDIRPRNWSKNSYFKSSLCEHALTLISTVPYLDRSLSTVEEFYSLYEKAGIPVILRGWIDDWPAFSEWTLEKLEKNYKRSSFKVGEDDDGHRIKMRMKYFMDYLRHQQDDSPLYLFESAVEERISTSKLLKDWQVPDVFPFDLHGLLGEEMRPPWFCIGPKRSGSSIHIDPMGTSAWNALIQGYKWWVMCPSGTDKTIVKGKHLWKEGEADEAIVWFDKILPRIKATYPQVKFLEVVQKAGEVIFVPPGWWHAVLNLNDSISCTQNFVSPANFDLAWICARQSRPKLAYVWLNRLKYFLPELHARAVYLNEKDGWERLIGKMQKKPTFSDPSFIRYPNNSEVVFSTSSSSSSSSSESSEDEEELCSIRDTLREKLYKSPFPIKVISGFKIPTENSKVSNLSNILHHTENTTKTCKFDRLESNGNTHLYCSAEKQDESSAALVSSAHLFKSFPAMSPYTLEMSMHVPTSTINDTSSNTKKTMRNSVPCKELENSGITFESPISMNGDGVKHRKID